MRGLFDGLARGDAEADVDPAIGRVCKLCARNLTKRFGCSLTGLGLESGSAQRADIRLVARVAPVKAAGRPQAPAQR